MLNKGTFKRPSVVVLTGGVASGKSQVAQWWEQWGASVIDTDSLSRSLTSKHGEALLAIRESFGEQFAPINHPDGLNRTLMRERVFADPLARKTLESILHPRIRARQQQEVAQAIAKGGTRLIVVQIPLFTETGAPRYYPALGEGFPAMSVDCVVVVESHPADQCRRMIESRGMNAPQAWAVIQSQSNKADRRLIADEVLTNRDNLAKLETSALELFSRLTN